MTKNKEFKNFSEQDFINHPYFQDWILSPDEEKNSFWQNFLSSYPEKKEPFEKARSFLKAIVFKEHWPANERIENSLNDSLNIINGKKKRSAIRQLPARVKPLYRSWWVAAALLIAVCGVWFLTERNKPGKASLAVAPKAKDIAPGGNQAILTLADGSKIVLDKADNGAVTKQGQVTVIKLKSGQLAYSNEGASTEVLYNTISTPRGGQYQLILADGTKVWLNAASSLRFPTAFTQKERRVELTGEGYFEVAHDASKPFHVMVTDMDVQVMGTHFNINSYHNEPLLKTTLLEGRIMIKKNDQLVYLNPGQQALLQNRQDSIRVTDDADAEEAVAWKNGMFIFNNTPLDAIMRQIERWYNVDVVYQGNISRDRFNGSIGRNTNLSEVLKVLEYSDIRFKVEGNRITVLSQ